MPFMNLTANNLLIIFSWGFIHNSNIFSRLSSFTCEIMGHLSQIISEGLIVVCFLFNVGLIIDWQRRTIVSVTVLRTGTLRPEVVA